MQPLPLRAASDIFSVLSCADHSHMALGVSCYEIYGGKLFDLLNERNKLEVREDARRNVQVGAGCACFVSWGSFLWGIFKLAVLKLSLTNLSHTTTEQFLSRSWA